MNKAMSRITILRDSREREGHGWKWDKRSTWCEQTEKAALKTGDYIIKEIPDLIVIERKADYKELCMNFTTQEPRRRFFEELERMQEFRFRFIVVECTFDEAMNRHNYTYLRAGRIRNNAPTILLGTIAAIHLKYGVHVIFAGKRGKDYAARLFLKAFEYYMKDEANGSTQGSRSDSREGSGSSEIN
jgi:ERCC4-type nuclease